MSHPRKTWELQTLRRRALQDPVVIIPKPKKFAKRMAGLHREVWQGAEAYLQDERKDW
jgi:hypothetical protein